MSEVKDAVHNDQKKPIPALVVSRPGIMQQSLRVILENLQQIEVITYVGDGLNALMLVRQHHPGLLILDHNLLEEETQGLLLAVKGEYPATQCLVIASSRLVERRLKIWGADAVVFRNAPTEEMRTTLLELAHKASLPAEKKSEDISTNGLEKDQTKNEHKLDR